MSVTVCVYVPVYVCVLCVCSCVCVCVGVCMCTYVLAVSQIILPARIRVEAGSPFCYLLAAD